MSQSPRGVSAESLPANLPVDWPSGLAAVDRILAASLLLLSAPVLVLVGSTLAALSGRSPLVAHRRVGKGGQPIWLLKFRTMWSGAPEEAGPSPWVERIVARDVLDIKPRHDPRVTSRFARLCRTYSLDELPQLIQATTGQLSLVGPRPLTAYELDKYYGDAQQEILALTPGLTGLWQIRGRNHLTYRQRVRYDRFFARNYSWRLYFFVLLRTIPNVLSGSGAW